MAPRILQASADVSLDAVRFEPDSPVLLEFIVLPPRSFFFKRSNPVKFKSPPLSLNHHWNATLSMDAESRVLLRLRIPSRQGKDRKSLSLDVSAAALSQQQSLSLSCRVGAKLVEAKVLLTMSEAAGAITSDGRPCQPKGLADAATEAYQTAAVASGATSQSYSPSQPVAATDAEATYWDSQPSEGSEQGGHSARMSPAVSAAEPGLGQQQQQQQQQQVQQQQEQQPPARILPSQNKRPWWSLAGLLSFSLSSSGAAAPVAAAPMPPSSSAEQPDAPAAPSSMPLPPQASSGSLRRLIDAAGARLSGLRGQSAPCSAAPSPRPSGTGRAPSVDGSLLLLEGTFLRAGGLSSLSRGIHGAYHDGGSGSHDSSMDGASPQHKRPRMSGLATLLSMGTQARASVAPLPLLPPRPPARAGRPPTTPERILKPSCNSASTSPSQPQMPQALSHLAPAPGGLRLDILAALVALKKLGAEQGPCAQRSEYKTVLEQLLVDEAVAEKASIAAKGVGSVEEATTRAKLNSVLMEIAPFDKGALMNGGWYATHLPLRASIVEAPHAPEETCSGRQCPSKTAVRGSQPAAAVPVRALYADVDQVVAGGELACTCVALEVVAWMDATASLLPTGGRPLTSKVLSELVLRGSSMWRMAKLEAAAGSDGMLEVDTALELRNRQRSVQLCVVQSAFSQVGCEGLMGADTTFPAFAKAASSAAAAAYASLSPEPQGLEHCSTPGLEPQPAVLPHPSTFLLVASGHSTAAWFLHDGRVLLVNSLGRSLAPSCKHAHALEFATVDDFCAVYARMVLPAGIKPAQVEAHKVARQRPVGGSAELLMFMPGG